MIRYYHFIRVTNSMCYVGVYRLGGDDGYNR
jgi:hypothetical protein